jgi:hypothetical protein
MDHLILPSLRRKLPWRGWSVIPGGITYSVPGTYTFIVPSFNTLTVDVRGAGGGGGGWRSSDQTVYDGGPGGFSYFNTPVNGNIVGYGGGPGHGWYAASLLGTGAAPATPGTGQNGDTNITGGGSNGGAAAISGGTYANRYPSPGGAGGRAVKTWVRAQQYSQLWKGYPITVVVGAGGVAGTCEPGGYLNTYSTDGSPGWVNITWS